MGGAVRVGGPSLSFTAGPVQGGVASRCGSGGRKVPVVSAGGASGLAGVATAAIRVGAAEGAGAVERVRSGAEIATAAPVGTGIASAVVGTGIGTAVVGIGIGTAAVGIRIGTAAVGVGALHVCIGTGVVTVAVGSGALRLGGAKLELYPHQAVGAGGGAGIRTGLYLAFSAAESFVHIWPKVFSLSEL